MKVAVIGSRGIFVPDLEKYLPPQTTEIVSGGAVGVDRSAREYAKKHNLKLTEFLPQYEKYKKGAPLKRNDEIIEYADLVLIFWDKKSSGTKYVIEQCKKKGVAAHIYVHTNSK